GLRGTITNSGTILLNASGGSADLHIAGGATLTGGGTINMGTNANGRVFGDVSLDTLINLDNTIQGAGQIGVGIMGLDNRGTIIANQPIQLTINPEDSAGFTNRAMLQVNAGSTLNLVGPGIVQVAGLTLVNGTLTADNPLLIAGGSLAGSGTIVGNVSNNGTLAPGTSAGALTVQGNLTELTSSRLSIELGGFTQSTQYDFLPVTGAATLAGSLHVSFINGFQSSVTTSATFTVLTAGTLAGAFANIANGARLTTDDGFGSFHVAYDDVTKA